MANLEEAQTAQGLDVGKIPQMQTRVEQGVERLSVQLNRLEDRLGIVTRPQTVTSDATTGLEEVGSTLTMAMAQTVHRIDRCTEQIIDIIDRLEL